MALMKAHISITAVSEADDAGEEPWVGYSWEEVNATLAEQAWPCQVSIWRIVSHLLKKTQKQQKHLVSLSRVLNDQHQQANSSDYDNTKTLASFLNDGPAPCSDVLMHTTLPHSAMPHTYSVCTIPKRIWSSRLGGQYKQPHPLLNPSNTCIVLMIPALLFLHAIHGGQG